MLSLVFYTVGKVVTAFRFSEQVRKERSVEYAITDEVVKDIKIWINTARSLPTWNETKEARFQRISKRMVFMKDAYMPKLKSSGDSIARQPLAYTSYEVIDSILEPKKIVFSDKILFEKYGRRMIVFHELGHAVCMLEDETCCFEYQLMWNSALSTYHMYAKESYMMKKLQMMLMKPESEEMKRRLINQNEIKSYSNIKINTLCTIH